MKRSHVIHAVALTLLLSFATSAQAVSSAYAGIAGVGIQTTQPLADRFSWGLKGEAGLLDAFGLVGAALLRYDVPSESLPLYVQLGLGARFRVSDTAKLQPWPTLGFGAKIDRYNVILQLLGYPVIGLEFPIGGID